ncbi:hypothetical protein BH09ACT12_BH09ACT12_09100 [soil metagenome]
MATSRRRPRPRDNDGSVRGTLVLVLLLALVAGGVATWRYDLLDGRLDSLFSGDGPSGGGPGALGDPTSDPVAVPPPPGLELPEVVRPDPVATPSSTGGLLDVTAVRRALAPYLRDPDIGRHVRVAVAPLGGGPVTFASGKQPAMPASTTKLVTSTAALIALGPDHVFPTSVRIAPAAGRKARLTLVGGGDPFLERTPTATDGSDWPYPARADLTTLAERTAKALHDQGVRRVSLSYDDTLFVGPAVNPRWEAGYVPGEVAPTSALWVDEARTITRYTRVPDAGLEAANSYANALRSAGVDVMGEPAAQEAPPRSQPLVQVDSAPLGEIVQRLLDVSDNDAAEVLLRHIGIAVSGVGSIEAGRRGVRSLLSAAGVGLDGSILYDGSGLSRSDRMQPGLLIDVLRLAADPTRPELRSVIEGLPVAGFTGSLSSRMDEGPPAGLGRVRAKTGTLMNVSTLAGVGTDLDGTVFAFVLMADAIKPAESLDARQTLDSAAAALGACHCTV